MGLKQGARHCHGSGGTAHGGAGDCGWNAQTCGLLYIGHTLGTEFQRADDNTSGYGKKDHRGRKPKDTKAIQHQLWASILSAVNRPTIELANICWK